MISKLGQFIESCLHDTTTWQPRLDLLPPPSSVGKSSSPLNPAAVAGVSVSGLVLLFVLRTGVSLLVSYDLTVLALMDLWQSGG